MNVNCTDQHETYCFGIDVGGTTIKCGLFEVTGQLIDKWEIPTRTENNGSAILPDAAAAIAAKMKERQLSASEVFGIGIGIPGPVNEAGEVPAAVNLHWGYVHIVNEMQSLTGLKVKAANDANAAALGEMWKGGGAGYQNVCLVTLGTGVGGGIVHDGKIVVGSHGGAGELGHIHVSDSITKQCNCGNYGCLEQVASATGITNLAKSYLQTSTAPSVLRDADISAKAVFDAVKAQDTLAMEIGEQFGKYLGVALAHTASVLDPDIFIIGGGVSKAGTILIDYVQKYYTKYAFIPSKNTPFALAQLGNDAGIYGAAKLVC